MIDEIQISMNIINSLSSRMSEVKREIKELIDKEYEIKGKMGLTGYTLRLKKALLNAESVFDSFEHRFADVRLDASNKPPEEPKKKDEEEGDEETEDNEIGEE